MVADDLDDDWDDLEGGDASPPPPPAAAKPARSRSTTPRPASPPPASPPKKYASKVEEILDDDVWGADGLDDILNDCWDAEDGLAPATPAKSPYEKVARSASLSAPPAPPRSTTPLPPATGPRRAVSSASSYHDESDDDFFASLGMAAKPKFKR